MYSRLMSVFAAAEIEDARLFSELAHANPFTPDRLRIERGLLGARFEDAGIAWSLDPVRDDERPNLPALRERAERLKASAQARLRAGAPQSMEALRLYEDLVLYTLYERFEGPLHQVIVSGPVAVMGRLFEEFKPVFEEALAPAWALGLASVAAEQAFALLWQLRRGFHYIHRRILGGSVVAADLRASVWQSVFTHDFARYRRGLYLRMHEIPTLILGPSGTGKELVAGAIGASRFIAFDPKSGRFEADHDDLFRPVHLAALVETLVEAELFGHEKGAFTGAHQARPGLLEGRSPCFTIFLDEIGDVPLALQVKLLRVLQDRSFQRVGGLQVQTFHGKVIAATHRNLPGLIEQGRFREDLYYRLCADVVRTPSLADQVRQDVQELERLVTALSSRMVDARDVQSLVAEVLETVQRDVGLDYAWPGNIRELEQCIRNVLVRGCYVPSTRPAVPSAQAQLLKEIAGGQLTVDALVSRYATLVYADEGTFEGTARRLQIDRRTVKRRIDQDLLAALNRE